MQPSILLNRRAFLSALTSLALTSLDSIASEPLSPPPYCVKTAPLLDEKYRVKPDKADKDISLYFQKNCRDFLERSIIYIPKTRSIEDISETREAGKVNFSIINVENSLNETGNIIAAHPHIIALSQYFNSQDKKHHDALEKYSEYTLRRRLMRETPSSLSPDGTGDLATLLKILYDTISKPNRNPNQPEPHLDFRIVVLDRWINQRVISIEIKKELLDRIRNFDYTSDFMKAQEIKESLIDYDRIIEKYKKDHIGCDDPFEISDKPEPSFPELARQINEQTQFTILDHGYIDIK